MASWAGCSALGFSGILAAESSKSLTLVSQNLRGWTAKDRWATREVLSYNKSNEFRRLGTAQIDQSLRMYQFVYVSADVREPLMYI